MNKTYNRIFDLVVNERLEEGKKWDAVKYAGKIALGGAALTAGAQFASQLNPQNQFAEKALARSGRAVQHMQSKTYGTKGQVEGQPKPVGGLSPHPRLGKYGVKVARPRHRVVKNESVMNKTYNRILDLVTSSERTDEVSQERAGNAIEKRELKNLANTKTAEEHGRQADFHFLQGDRKKELRSGRSQANVMKTVNKSRDQQTRVLKNMERRKSTGAFTDPKDK